MAQYSHTAMPEAVDRKVTSAPQPGQWLAERGTRPKQAGQATVASWARQ